MHSGTLPDDLIQTLEPGLIAGAGAFAAQCQRFDRLLEKIALRRGATPCVYPSILPCELLQRLEYFDSFPSTATRAGEHHALTPAVCYHAYRALEGRTLSQHPYRLTAAGPCARWEGERITESPERLWCFHMREAIFFGSAEEIARECRILERSLHRALAKEGLATTVEPATDPFFGGGASRGKLLAQRLKRLKVELRVALPDGRSLALASVNNHGTFFTDRMRIGFADGTPATSGCVAIGLERCAYASLLHASLNTSRDASAQGATR